MPLNALRGILEHDAHILYLVADSVGFCPVLLFSGGGALCYKSFDFFVVAVVGAGVVVINDTENAGKLVKNSDGFFYGVLCGRGGKNGLVDKSREVENDSDSVSRVEVVVHCVAEACAEAVELRKESIEFVRGQLVLCVRKSKVE